MTLTTTLRRPIAFFPILAASLLLLPACSSDKPDVKAEYPEHERYENSNRYGSILDADKDGGLTLFDFGGKKNDNQIAGNAISVNSYLWRATLDTVSFMPLLSADANGGVIITDWYAPPQAPAERVKMTILIKSRELRADGVKVTLFRQAKNSKGEWEDAAPNPAAAGQVEDAILTRARQLRSEAGPR